MTHLPIVNDVANDLDPALSADGCTLYFASNRGGATLLDIYQATMR